MKNVNPIKRAVIPVAGLGTRMLPATKAIPKELLPVFDRPIIEHVVREAINGGITEIIFVTRSGKEAIENHFDAHYELEHRLVNKGKEKVLESIASIVPDNVKITSKTRKGFFMCKDNAGTSSSITDFVGFPYDKNLYGSIIYVNNLSKEEILLYLSPSGTPVVSLDSTNDTYNTNHAFI